LGEITESFSGGTPQAGNSDYYDGKIPFIRSGEIGEDKTELFITEKGLNNSAAKIVEKGDILYALYGATSGEVGISQINGAINQAILAIRPIKEYNSYLIVQWLLKQKEAIIRTYLQGGQGNLSGSIVKDLVLMLPGDKNEQQKIGAFFKQLDDTITLHQRKLDALKQIKKGFLQQMFPENREKVPRVRFTDFDENWEQRKLEEVSTHRGGTAIEKYFNENGKYKVISIGSYGTDSKYVDQGIRAISNEITDTRVVHEGELTMVLNDKTSNGTIIGRSLLIDSEEEYVINQRTEIVSPNADFNVNFAYITLNNAFREKVKKIVQGGTQIYVNYPAVKSLTLDFPSYEEQTKIGTFFKQLDGTIVLHQQKLEQLKTLKNAYLQNMFI
jgi:type I restriction enzyme S subunit